MFLNKENYFLFFNWGAGLTLFLEQKHDQNLHLSFVEKGRKQNLHKKEQTNNQRKNILLKYLFNSVVCSIIENDTGQLMVVYCQWGPLVPRLLSCGTSILFRVWRTALSALTGSLNQNGQHISHQAHSWWKMCSLVCLVSSLLDTPHVRFHSAWFPPYSAT